MQLSIIVPAHNEEHRIGRMLDAYLPFFVDRYGSDVEFIVVINGSTDDTERVVNGYTERYPQLTTIMEPDRIGKGGALMLGFKEASGELVGFSDADGSTPPEAFHDLIDSIGDADTIIASRWCKGAQVSPKQPLARRIASRAFNMLTRMLFGLHLTDTQCGAKLLNRDAMQEVLPDLGITRWAFDVDLLFQLKRAGRKIIEIPTTWCDIAGSKVKVAQTSFDMALALTRLRLVYSPFRWVVFLYQKYIDPFIHPPGMEHDHLFRHSFLLMIGGQVAGIGNVLFQMVMVRMLSDVEYGVMASMLGVFFIVSVPMGALGRSSSHFTARLIQDGRRDEIAGLVRRLLRDLTAIAVPCLLLAVVFRHSVAGFFRLESVTPMLITLFAVVATLYRPITGGALNGAQAFFWCSALGISWSFLRIVLAVFLVLCVGGASGALLGHLLAVVASLALSFVLLLHVVRPATAGTYRSRGVYRYFAFLAAALLGYAVLSYADMIIVKHYFAATEAGQYAYAAMAARIAFFLPQPIVNAMFPKVVSSGATSRESRRTLLKALVLVAIVVAGAAMVCTLIPGLILRVLTGEYRPELISLVRTLAWALAPLPVILVIMNYELAQRRYAIAWPLLMCAAGYLAIVTVWHQTLHQVVYVLAAASVCALVMASLCLCLTRRAAGAAE